MKFLSDDGKVFETAEECRAHEALLVSLVGLTQADIDEALADPVNSALAALIEKTAKFLAKRRIEMGGRKRAANSSRAAPAPPTPEETAKQVEDFDDVMGVETP